MVSVGDSKEKGNHKGILYEKLISSDDKLFYYMEQKIPFRIMSIDCSILF